MCRHVLIIAAGILPCALHAQVDTTARLMGSVRSAFNGRPLSAVMIAVPEARKFVVTDSTGTFRLAGLPVGVQKVFVAYSGRATEEYEFELRHEKTKRLVIVLDVEAVDLAPIVVQVSPHGDWKDLAGFYARRKHYGGWGTFFTQEDIQRERFHKVADILRRVSVYTRCIREGCVPTRMVRGVICPVTVMVDGILFYETDYESVLIEDVRGVEWYGGSFGPPPTLTLFAPRSLSATRDSGWGARRCPGQAVAIWTARR